MNGLSPSVFRLWVHSHEEDTVNVKVYRRSDYNFPPVRGRTGFEIKDNGEFIEYDIGPDDRPKISSGRWKQEGTNRIKVSFRDREHKSYTTDIISVDEHILKIRR